MKNIGLLAVLILAVGVAFWLFARPDGPFPRRGVAAQNMRRDAAPDGAAAAALAAELGNRVHFDFDRAVLRPDDQMLLDRKAAILRSHPAMHIRITGNCDERGSEAYNLALGVRRAAAARKYLIDHGIATGRIEIGSNGKYAPLDPAHTPAAWAANRRDDFQMMP